MVTSTLLKTTQSFISSKVQISFTIAASSTATATTNNKPTICIPKNRIIPSFNSQIFTIKSVVHNFNFGLHFSIRIYNGDSVTGRVIAIQPVTQSFDQIFQRFIKFCAISIFNNHIINHHIKHLQRDWDSASNESFNNSTKNNQFMFDFK
ncbi:hypothetical protein ACTA71_007750 [Dictyostelium dimigraforme]